MAPPLFVVIEPASTSVKKPVRRLSWRCDSDAGAAAGRRELGPAAQRIAALSMTHALFVPDPLFDSPRLEALVEAHDRTLASPPRDWLLALAPFNQARNLTAILEAAKARAAKNDPAGRLWEAWLEARARAEEASNSLT